MFKIRKRLLALAVVLSFIFWVAFYLRPRFVPPILMYHVVAINPDPRNRTAVSLEDFKRQMRFLKEHRYNVVFAKEMAEMIAKKSKLPPKTVALTFDDGTEDNFLLAFPVLKEYGLKATIFLIYGQMDRPGWLKWEEIKSMQESSLVEFASHTSAHAYLPGVSSEEALRKEIFDSKKALEEKLGRKVSGFSYPVGGFNPRVRQLVIDAGYSYAATVRPGKRFPDDDLFALKRIRVSHAPFWLISYWIKLSGYYTSILESRRK